MTTTAGHGPQELEMRRVLVFSYGSNLDEKQMRSRCASARSEAHAVLPGHALAFGGFSRRWGGAVATVMRTRGAMVQGMRHSISELDLEALDRCEGCPGAYKRVLKAVIDERGRRRHAQVYIQPERGLECCAPPLGYFGVILRAYARLGFDVKRLALAVGVRS